MKKGVGSFWHYVIGGIFLFTFCASFLVFWFQETPSVQAVTCSSGAAAQNDITVVPSHGNVFYIDTGVTPVLDAGYIGYRITNGTGSTQDDLWAEVSDFSGGKITLANALDSSMQLESLTDGSTGTAYFMLKATGASTTAQAHTLKIYNHRPDLSNASLLYECDFSFSKVQETIKAAANKVADNGLTSSAAIEVSDTSPELGQLITITVEGQTGQIGQGSTPDFDMIWLTPAAVSTWPTRALRLESVSVVFDGNGNWANTGDQVTYTDQLLIPDADGLTNVDNSEYRTTYQFRVIGRPNSTVTAVPVAQISSGTQVKHSDTGATGGTLAISFSSLDVNAALTKSVTSTTGLTVVDCSGVCAVTGQSSSGEIYVEVPYRLTAASTTVTDLTVDEFVDQVPDEIIFKPGSATVTDIGRTGVAISDPVTITTDADPKPLHFIGPFTLDSGTNASVDYTMWVPVGSYANIAYAKIGDLLIGATSSAMSRITVTSIGTSTVIVVADTVDFSVSAITDPATDLATTTATLNGTVDPNGTLILTGEFEYGTSPSLTGATTVTATTPVSGTLNGLTDPTAVSVGLTGLSSGTTYYFRVIAGSAEGAILSFTTSAVAGTPTVTTTAATSVLATTATLNGTINPNLTSITGIQFIYGTSPTLASGNTTATIDDGSGIAALTAGGSSEQPFSQDLTGLSNGTTYYFKIRACTSALTGTYPSVSCTSYTDGSILSFTAGLTARTLTIDALSYEAGGYLLTEVPPTITSTASAGAGTKTYSSSTTGVCTINSSTGEVTFVAAGTCTIGAAIASDGTYSAANASEISFTLSLAPRTLTIDDASYDDSYTLIDTPPTITSTASAGAGTKTYSSSTTGVCTIDSSTGEVAFVAAGTCTLSAAIASDGTYLSANALDISFDITDVPLTPRTHVIDAESYEATYTLIDAPPTITSTPSAGVGTKSYSSSTPGVCTIDGSTGVVEFVGTGTCTIGSSIASDGTYASADADSISFTVSLAPRSIEIDSVSFEDDYTLSETPPTITSTASAGGGTKTYSSSTPSVCTIDASTGEVTFVSRGACAIGVEIASDDTYVSADATEVSFEVRSPADGDPTPPVPSGASLVIQSGATCVTGYAVNLTLSATDATDVLLSNDPAFFQASWTPFSGTSSSYLWELSSGYGTKTVYAMFKNGAMQSNVVTDTITFAASCTEESSESSESFEEEQESGSASGAQDSSEQQSSSGEETSAPSSSTPGSSVERTYTYDISIINPDHTVRGLRDDRYVRVRQVTPTVDIIRFEDKGSDFDFDDVVVKVDHTNWHKVIVTVLSVNANWKHNVRFSLLGGTAPLTNALLWPDSHVGVRRFVVLDVDQAKGIESSVRDEWRVYLHPNGALPILPESLNKNPSPETSGPACDLLCEDITYDLYLINPNGVERHRGGLFVRETTQDDGVILLGFEDSGLDFDYDDVRVFMDARDCSQVTFTLLDTHASWHHEVGLHVNYQGEQKFSEILWADTQQGNGETRVLNVRDNALVCETSGIPAVLEFTKTDSGFIDSYGSVIMQTIVVLQPAVSFQPISMASSLIQGVLYASFFHE